MNAMPTSALTRLTDRLASPPSGDLNDGCRVDLSDFGTIAENRLRCNFDSEKKCFER